MSEKVTGYLLLFVGIVVIIFSAFSVYSVFTKRSKPIELFSFSGISLDPSSLLPSDLPLEARQLMQQQNTKKVEMFPAEMINGPINTYAHLFLMGFIASIGFKLAQLGTLLVRPIVVHLKAKEVTVAKPEDGPFTS